VLQTKVTRDVPFESSHVASVHDEVIFAIHIIHPMQPNQVFYVQAVTIEGNNCLKRLGKSFSVFGY